MDKKVGLFRKTKKKPEPKKKVRVEEFKFDKGFGMPDFKLQPGQIIKTRQSGRNEFYELYRQLQERGMPMPEFRAEYTPRGDNPFGDWRKPVDDAKINFCIEMIHLKHGYRIECQTGRGDYVEFYGRSNQQRHRISMTQIHTIDPGKLIDRLETVFNLDNSRVKKNDSSEFEKNPTESWAEKWAKENQ